jgi:hypothetical protein
MSAGIIVRRGGVGGVSVGAGSGGTEVTSGGYKYHTFISSGTFTVDTAGLFEVLAIGGGGGGGGNGYAQSMNGGGGGAGGLVNATIYMTSGAKAVVVGAGGAGAPTRNYGFSGADSTIDVIQAIGGGAGGYYFAGENYYGNFTGGCGGGGIYAPYGIGLQGYDSAGRGGGGLGSSGSGFNGGAGTNAYSAWATATSTGDSGYFGSGGGGFTQTAGGASTYGVSGGLGGGADATYDTANHADANTGGGGGARWRNVPGSGGSGIVIIRYAV